jgi:hypothetical protein
MGKPRRGLIIVVTRLTYTDNPRRGLTKGGAMKPGVFTQLYVNNNKSSTRIHLF